MSIKLTYLFTLYHASHTPRHVTWLSDTRGVSQFKINIWSDKQNLNKTLLRIYITRHDSQSTSIRGIDIVRESLDRGSNQGLRVPQVLLGVNLQSRQEKLNAERPPKLPRSAVKCHLQSGTRNSAEHARADLKHSEFSTVTLDL